MSSDAVFLDAAAGIGRRLVADAVWHDGRCSWMGGVEDPDQPWRMEYRAIASSLYGGTAGVGLFLAQLGAVTGDAAVRRTAAGAIRQAVARTRETGPADGLHAGSLGVAWAAARAAGLLDDDALHAAAHSVVVDAMPGTVPDRCPDISTGCAGSLVALLALAAALDDPELLLAARRAGDQLVSVAGVTRRGWSWSIPGRRYPHDLCGMAHGAAGIGWALLELFAATGDGRFRTAAAGAFAYERSWLDTGSGTWPDLRVAAMHPIAPATTGTWCYGEAGIALTRLRAIDVLGEERHLDDARVALETTRRRVADALPYDLGDLTLCHGAAGAADVLLSGADALGAAGQEPEALAAAALERGSADRISTPGLFRGMSGVGWWLLRVHDHAMPSPLTMPLHG